MNWNVPPERFKYVPDDKLKFNMNLEARIISLKDELAELAKDDPEITIAEAIINLGLQYAQSEESYLLEEAVERLKLYNILDYRVTRYLPSRYHPKNKPRLYLPEDF